MFSTAIYLQEQSLCQNWFKHELFLTVIFPQTPAGEEAAVQTLSTAAAEELQYGEVTFFKGKPEASFTSEEYSKQEETVYAHVKVSKSRKCSTHTTDSPDDIYAQVKKK